MAVDERAIAVEKTAKAAETQVFIIMETLADGGFTVIYDRVVSYHTYVASEMWYRFESELEEFDRYTEEQRWRV